MVVAGLPHEVDVGLLVKEWGGAFRALGLLRACDWGVDSLGVLVVIQALSFGLGGIGLFKGSEVFIGLWLDVSK